MALNFFQIVPLWPVAVYRLLETNKPKLKSPNSNPFDGNFDGSIPYKICVSAGFFSARNIVKHQAEILAISVIQRGFSGKQRILDGGRKI